MVNVLAALVAFPIGFGLAALLVAAFVQVLGWSLFNLAFAPLVPAPLDAIAQAMLGLTFLTSSWLGLLLVVVIIVGLIFAAYWIASTGYTVPGPPGTLLTATWPERLGRGGLIGFNAGINYVLLLGLIAGLPGGLTVATILAAIGFVACSRTVSNNAVFQVVLSYTTLALPMAAPMNALGLLTFAVNSAATVFGVPLALFVDWTRAGLIMHGGVVHGCVRTAFNLGNFTVAHPTMSVTDPWRDPGTPVWPFCPAVFSVGRFSNGTVLGVALHEGSHTLNLAAMGWIYTLIGFADQWAPMPWSPGAALGADAHAELCAESGVRGTSRNWLDAWAPSLAAATTANANAIANVVVPAAPGVVPITPVAGTIGVPAATVSLPVVVAERNRAITLDSTGSTDPDGFPMPLGRLWTLAVSPPGSTVPITTPNAGTLVFVPDVGGAWQIDFRITDGHDGGPAAGSIGALPVTLDVLQASIGLPAAPIETGAPLQIDGTVSAVPTGPDVGPATFAWRFLTVPAGSTLAAMVGGNTSFFVTPDVDGGWEVELTLAIDVTPADGGAPLTLSDVARRTFTSVPPP